MQDALNSLLQAHQQIKNVLVQAIQSDQEIDPRHLDTLKSTYSLIQYIKQAYGL